MRYDYYQHEREPPGRASRASRPTRASIPDRNLLDRVLFVPDQCHDYMSPHVQVSFPVTERTNFRLSYAH